MTYLFIGDNTHNRQLEINKIKSPWTSDSDAAQFDTQILYGHKLDPAELKKALLNLPAILDQRLIHIHDAEKIGSQGLTILRDVLAGKPRHLVLILECTAVNEKDELWKEIRACSQVSETRKGIKENVFDMTKRMNAGNSIEALNILHRLYADGAYPVQIMGGVVWAWGNERGRMSLTKFEQGLRDLQEADLNIKRSKMDPQQALEVVVVKLAALRK